MSDGRGANERMKVDFILEWRTKEPFGLTVSGCKLPASGQPGSGQTRPLIILYRKAAGSQSSCPRYTHLLALFGKSICVRLCQFRRVS